MIAKPFGVHNQGSVGQVQRHIGILHSISAMHSATFVSEGEIKSQDADPATNDQTSIPCTSPVRRTRYARCIASVKHAPKCIRSAATLIEALVSSNVDQ